MKTGLAEAVSRDRILKKPAYTLEACLRTAGAGLMLISL